MSQEMVARDGGDVCERRRHERYAVDGDAEVMVADGTLLFRGRVLDISVAGGVKIVVAGAPDPRQDVHTGDPEMVTHFSIEIDCPVWPDVFTCTNPAAFSSFRLNSAQEFASALFPSPDGPSTSCPGQ